ncbi:MAG: 2-C-methyl-D-erythritol 4-phosphate cytidylyltransferase [Lachnospiraceae bacterium]|nr:2-C-methyl-D-erythritol 4-phosphate cytidylyltransferase [Lachnospiraceae bacterium]
MMHKKCAAIVLSAGKGRRMNRDKEDGIAKQYLLLCGKPVIYYSLKAFEDSFADEIVLVAGGSDIEYCREKIVNEYGFKKISTIAEGGAERYDSVYAGLKAVSSDTEYVFIHDGARPFLTKAILDRAYETVEKYQSAIASMPVKDTIKIAGSDGIVRDTPDRNSLYMVQTPQVFKYSLIMNAYEQLIRDKDVLKQEGTGITDDAMVMERYGNCPIKLFDASYENIKLTTPEDMLIAEALMGG